MLPTTCSYTSLGTAHLNDLSNPLFFEAFITHSVFLHTYAPRPASFPVGSIEISPFCFNTILASVLFSAVLVLFFVLWGTKKNFVVFTGLIQSLFGLFFGISGSLLFFMTFFTNHDYTFHNSNILFINPLLFAAIPLGYMLGFGKTEKKRYICAQLSRILWIFVFLGGLLTMAIKLFPAFYQQNQVTQALVLPFALTLILIMTWFSRLSISKVSAKQ